MPKLTKAKTLHELLLNKLMALYDIEIQITKALPKMIKKVEHPDLKEALTSHLTETENQVKRLEHCFKLLDAKPKKLKSDAIRGLIDDANWVAKNVHKGAALDANIIAAAQYVEHYEMAGYGTAATWAKLMKHTEVEALLHETLSEEEAADQKLNQLAESEINSQVEMGM